MNKILKLFDEQYVMDLFNKEVLPELPGFSDIKKIEIKAFKKFIWEDTYHVVIKFSTSLLNKDKELITLPIYCSAHSDEPRENVYKALKYLWDNGFAEGNLTIPQPLFYSDYFQGTFYVGLEGDHLYSFMRVKKIKEVEEIISKAASWFAKLHNLGTEKTINFNPENSRIKTVIPGKAEILNGIKISYPSFFEFFKKAYDIFIKKEEDFLATANKLYLIHGDAHPENIIRINKKNIGLIDFTDICLSDFARDLGCFLQQFEYMAERKIKDKEFSDKMKKLFLDNYFKNAKIKLDDSLKRRIDNYYNWTAIRTATFFLLKEKAEPERAKLLIEAVKEKMDK